MFSNKLSSMSLLRFSILFSCIAYTLCFPSMSESDVVKERKKLHDDYMNRLRNLKSQISAKTSLNRVNNGKSETTSLNKKVDTKKLMMQMLPTFKSSRLPGLSLKEMKSYKDTHDIPLSFPKMKRIMLEYYCKQPVNSMTSPCLIKKLSSKMKTSTDDVILEDLESLALDKHNAKADYAVMFYKFCSNAQHEKKNLICTNPLLTKHYGNSP